MNEGNFSALWTKYLPVIRIILKKSIAEEQQVSLNKMEFEAVDNRKNANHSFALEIVKGKVINGIGGSIVGKDLFAVLNNDSSANAFMADKTIRIKMPKNSQMTLKADLVENEELEPA